MREAGLRAVQIVIADDIVVTVADERIWTESISNSNDGARTLQVVAEFIVEPGHDDNTMCAALLDIGRTSAFVSYEHPVNVVAASTPFGSRYKLRGHLFDLRIQFAFARPLTTRGQRALLDRGCRFVTAPVGADPDG